MVRNSCLSLICGLNWRQMFSTNVTLGASKVAEAQDWMADSSAPKNSTCMMNRHFFEHQGGQHFLRVFLEQYFSLLGHDDQRASD